MRLQYCDTQAVFSDVNVSDNKKRRGAVGAVFNGGWGASGMTEITFADEITSNPLYSERASDMVSDVLSNAEKLIICRPSGGTSASCTLGCARYEGESGNSIIIVCRPLSGDLECLYEVTTFAKNKAVDRQTVRLMSELIDSEYVIFNREAELFATAGIPMEGGRDAAMSASVYKECLELFDSSYPEFLFCTEEKELQAIFASHIKKLRAKGEVVYGVTSFECDDGTVPVYYEGEDTSGMVYYTAGVLASTPFYKTSEGAVYGGKGAALAYEDELSAEEASRRGIVYIRRGENVYLYGGDIISGDRELGEIKKLIRGLFESKYAGKVTADQAGASRLQCDIKKMLDGFSISYGIGGPTEICISYGDDGDVSAEIKLAPRTRPRKIRLFAMIC